MKLGNMRHFVKLAAVSLILSLALSLPEIQVAAAADTATVSVSAPAQAISPGSQFSISVAVTPNSAIAGAQFDLAYNPSLVTIQSIAEGNLLKQSGGNTYFTTGVTNNVSGTITGVAGTITTPGLTASAAGTFAVISMIAGSTKGNCQITLSKVILGDVKAQAVQVTTVDGNVNIGSSANRPPVLSPIGNKAVNTGSLLGFAISASDPDADALTYTASNLPPGANFNAASRTFSWTPTANQTGSYPGVKFEVTDGLLSVSETINIVVIPPAPSNGGGGGGGGGGGSAPPITNSPIGTDGVFKQTVEVKTDGGTAGVVVGQGTKGLTRDGTAISQITVLRTASPASPPEQSVLVSTVYSFGPDGATFDKPVDLTLSYDSSLILPVVDESKLVIANWDPVANIWVDLVSAVNIQNHTVTAKVNHFSIYAVLAYSRPAASSTNNPIVLPVEVVKEPAKAILAVSGLKVSAAEVNVGDMVTVSALITNSGSISGAYDVVMKINGIIEGQKQVAVNAGAGQEVSFNVTAKNPGSYSLDINGLSGLFVVKAPAPAPAIPSTPAVLPASNVPAVTSPAVTPVLTQAVPPGPISSQPPASVFSLSLLAEIIGGALVLIAATAALVLLRRRQLLKKS